MHMLYKSRACRGRRRATIKRADAEAIQIKGPHSEEKGDNQESGWTSRAHRGTRSATIKRAIAKAIQIEGPQREEKGGNKESGRRGYTNQGPAEGGEG